MGAVYCYFLVQKAELFAKIIVLKKLHLFLTKVALKVNAGVGYLFYTVDGLKIEKFLETGFQKQTQMRSNVLQ